VPGKAAQWWSESDDVRRLAPLFALAVGIVALTADPSSGADIVLSVLPVAAFALWAYTSSVPLPALAVAVLAPVVVAQRSGQLEPLLFDASLLAFVVGRWSRSPATAAALGLLAVASPVAAAVLQNPAEISVGIWILGIVFPLAIGRALARQVELAAELDATRHALAEQALSAERRRIARDVHDMAGHGLAAVMVQVTSARHVLRRDPDAAEEALRSAEEVGRHSMQDLRRTVTLLRTADETGAARPLPTAGEISALVAQARAGGLDVVPRISGEPSRVAPSVGVAIYRIAQEALANAAKHAPGGRTVVGLDIAERHASLVVETSGTTVAIPLDEAERPKFGLVGMRERASALGGEFSAGPTADGWRVSCRIPLNAANRGDADS
jgi:signal transduction histidine kinase